MRDSVCLLALGMRLHFTMFCCLAGTPVAALAYDMKVRDFMDRVGVPEAVIGFDELSPERVAETMLDLHRRAQEVSGRITRSIDSLKCLAERNNDILDSMIARNSGWTSRAAVEGDKTGRGRDA